MQDEIKKIDVLMPVVVTLDGGHSTIYFLDVRSSKLYDSSGLAIEDSEKTKAIIGFLYKRLVKPESSPSMDLVSRFDALKGGLNAR